MAGAFVMPLSVPLAAVMLTAILTVHFQYGFLSVRLLSVTPSGAVFGPIGYEMNLLYLAGLFILAMHGGGRLSIESLMKPGSGSPWANRCRRSAAGTAALPPQRSSFRIGAGVECPVREGRRRV